MMVNSEFVGRSGILVSVESPGALYNFLYGQVPFLTSSAEKAAFVQESLPTGSIGRDDMRFENILISESLSETPLDGTGFECESTELCLTRNEDGAPEVSINTVLDRSVRSVIQFPHFTIPMVKNIADRLEKKQLPSEFQFYGVSSSLHFKGNHPEELYVRFGTPGFIDPDKFRVEDKWFFSTHMGSRVLERARKHASDGVTNLNMTGRFPFGSEEQFIQDISGYASSYQLLLNEIYPEIRVRAPSVNISLRSAHNLLTRLVLE
jgi:hypothetical protein